MDYKTGLATIGIVGLTTLALSRKYLAGGICNITKDLSGQVVIVTGSNTGIGKETARVLARIGSYCYPSLSGLRQDSSCCRRVKERNGKPEY